MNTFLEINLISMILFKNELLSSQLLFLKRSIGKE